MFRNNEHEDEMAIVAASSEESLTELSNDRPSTASQPLPPRNYVLAQRDKLSQGKYSVSI